MLDNEWGNAAYPVVAGHEAVGRVVAVGEQAKGLAVGARVGVGWNAGSCLHCRHCLAGDQHLCPSVQATIVGHHGGFADRMRAHWAWAIPIPEPLQGGAVGPLLCGGITVFNPLVQFGVRPTHRVGVVGIGGLGHLALKFARAWGCEVTAFTSSPSKFDEAQQLGAHHVLSSRDSGAIQSAAGSLDMLLVTVNVALGWNALIATMLEFAARHGIAPQTEHFPLSEVNAALDHLRAGKARYRVVLDAAAAS